MTVFVRCYTKVTTTDFFWSSHVLYSREHSLRAEGNACVLEEEEEEAALDTRTVNREERKS